MLLMQVVRVVHDNELTRVLCKESDGIFFSRMQPADFPDLFSSKEFPDTCYDVVHSRRNIGQVTP